MEGFTININPVTNFARITIKSNISPLEREELQKKLANSSGIHLMGDCAHLTELVPSKATFFCGNVLTSFSIQLIEHTNLMFLKVAGCKLDNASRLNTFSRLVTLKLNRTGLTRLPRLELPDLTSLDVSSNDLECLPIDLPPKLEVLIVSNNPRLNRLSETTHLYLRSIKLSLVGTLLYSHERKSQTYARSNENFELAKTRYRSIVTLLVAKKFGKWVTQMIAKRAYYGWFAPREINKKFKKG